MVGFEESSYTITEGETGSVCVRITEPEITDIFLISSIQSRDGTASEN